MLNKTALPFLTITIFISGLHLLRELLIPLALAILLVYLTEPLNRVLIRMKVPGIFRVPVIIGVTTLGVLGLSRLVTHNLLALGKSLPHYEARLDELLSDLAVEDCVGSLVILLHDEQLSVVGRLVVLHLLTPDFTENR